MAKSNPMAQTMIFYHGDYKETGNLRMIYLTTAREDLAKITADQLIQKQRKENEEMRKKPGLPTQNPQTKTDAVTPMSVDPSTINHSRPETSTPKAKKVQEK